MHGSLNPRNIFQENEYNLDERLFTISPDGITSGNSGGPAMIDMTGLSA